MSTSAIHDIGYRGYDGRRLGRAYIIWSLFSHGFRAIYGFGRPGKSKILPFLLFGVMLLPALGSVAILAYLKQPEALISYSKYAVYLQPVVAIFVASQAPVVASRDLRFNVVPLYFSRPVRRLDYVLAKYAAFVAAVLLLLATPILIIFTGVLVTWDKKMWQPASITLGDHAADATAAIGGAAMFALVLGALGLLLSAYAPRRGFGVAAIIAVYLLSLGASTVIAGIAELNGDRSVQEWSGIITPFYLVDGIQVWAFGAQSASVAPPPPWPGGLIFTLTAAGIVALSLAGMLVRFRRAGA